MQERGQGQERKNEGKGKGKVRGGGKEKEVERGREERKLLNNQVTNQVINMGLTQHVKENTGKLYKI